MMNSITHINYVIDGMSKNDIENLTGVSIPPVIDYDNEYFKGKYVLLFDDVVTTGKTMLRYKKILENMGAKVVGGLCIGRTKHTK